MPLSYRTVGDVVGSQASTGPAVGRKSLAGSSA